MSNTHAISLKRSTALLAALTFMTLLTVVNFAAFFGTAGAAQLTSRQLTLSSSLPGNQVGDSVAGSATNGSDAEHVFAFNIVTAGATAMRFDYCTTPIGGCTMPTGLDLTSVDVGTVSGVGSLGTPVVGNAAPGTGNRVTLTGGTLSVGAAVVTLDTIVNPTDLGTFFVRMSTSSDSFATVTDEGTVASAITEGITITTRVVETLGFSTTATGIGTLPAGSASNCPALSGSGAINLGLSPDFTLDINNTYGAYSAFRIYTNAANGAAVTYEGDTLRRGSNPLTDPDINEIGGTATAPATSTEQFGLAVHLTDADTEVDSSANTTHGGTGQLAIGAQYQGGALTGAVPSGTYAFVANTPTEIASSASTGGYVDCDTYAVQYMANVSPVTPSGTYTTTIVYVAVPQY